MGGDDCEAFGKSTKKNPVTKIDVKDIDDVKEGIAQAMYDCNSMLGEGKLNFMPSPSWREGVYGLTCARFGFDKKAREELKELKYTELYKYMSEKQDPEGRDYLTYIYPSWVDWRASENLFEEVKKYDPQNKLQDLKLDDWKINLETEDGHAIVAEMFKKGQWVQSLTTGGVVVAEVVGIILSATGKLPLGAGLLKIGAVAGGFLIVYTDASGEYEYAPPFIIPYDLKSLESLKVTSFEFAP